MPPLEACQHGGRGHTVHVSVAFDQGLGLFTAMPETIAVQGSGFTYCAIGTDMPHDARQ